MNRRSIIAFLAAIFAAPTVDAAQVIRRKPKSARNPDCICGNCIYYEAGSCKRYPPTVIGAPPATKYPAPQPSDWCGEYKPVDVPAKKA